MHRYVYQEAKPFPRLRSSLVTQARSAIPGLPHPLVFFPLFLQTGSPFSTSCTCLPQALPTRPSLKQLVCSWCQVKASLSQDTGSPFQSQFMPLRCERSPPPPHTPGHQVCPHLCQGLRTFCPQHRFVRSTSLRTSMSFSPGPGQSSPQGARPGPRAGTSGSSSRRDLSSRSEIRRK